MCALLISTKGIEHIIVRTYPGGEVAVHYLAVNRFVQQNVFDCKHLTFLSTCSKPATDR